MIEQFVMSDDPASGIPRRLLERRDTSTSGIVVAGVNLAAPTREDVWGVVAEIEPALRRYIQFRVSGSEAKDVLHDFYVRVFEQAHRLRLYSSARPWLYRLLRSALFDHVRANRRQCDVSIRLRIANPTTDDDCSERLFFAELLTQLKPEYADILRRLQMRADTSLEAAADLRTTPNNVRVRHFRARVALRTAFTQSNERR